MPKCFPTPHTLKISDLGSKIEQGHYPTSYNNLDGRALAFDERDAGMTVR